MSTPPPADAAIIAAWCETHLDCRPVTELFRAEHLSRVIGMRLSDGTAVVVKIRKPAPRLDACFAVHRHLFDAGFACPEPLVAPAPLGRYAATAERFVPGEPGLPSSGRSPALFASALAELITLAPPPEVGSRLDPAPPWTAWDHGEGGLWPSPDDIDRDLDRVVGPPWVDDAAAAARDHLRRCASERVIGHGDWYADNLCWTGDRLQAVHDWDSVICAPEEVIAGLAAAGFASTGRPGEAVTVHETEHFLAEFQAATGRAFSPEQLSYAWAAGLWLRVFDAKKEFARDGEVYSCDESDAAERLRRMR